MSPSTFDRREPPMGDASLMQSSAGAGLDAALASGGLLGVIDALRTMRLTTPVLDALTQCRAEVAIEATRPYSDGRGTIVEPDYEAHVARLEREHYESLDAQEAEREAEEADADCCEDRPPAGHYVTIYVAGCASQEMADEAVAKVLDGAEVMAACAHGNDPATYAYGCERVIEARTGPDGNVTMDVVHD